MTSRQLGLLRIRVVRGIGLAIRDGKSSDPYCVLKLGDQKLRTSVIRKNTNPQWNEDLTFSVADPSIIVRLEVYDKDKFTFADPMGYAEFEIRHYVEAVKMNMKGIPNGTAIKKLLPKTQNFLAEESIIYCKDGKVIQDMTLRLRKVECGEIELQLHWVDIPGSRNQ